MSVSKYKQSTFEKTQKASKGLDGDESGIEKTQ